MLALPCILASGKIADMGSHRHLWLLKHKIRESNWFLDGILFAYYSLPVRENRVTNNLTSPLQGQAN